MSVHWTSWVWDNSPYRETKLLVHLALADIAHKDGRFFASQVQLSEMAKCSVEYIRRIIRELEADGHLRIVTKGNGRGRATVYQLIGLETPNTKPPFNQVENPQPQHRDSENQNPQLWNDKPPTQTPETPNATTTPTVLYNNPNTTVALAKAIADKWWKSQEIKPIGKNAYWSLVEVCKAALSRYSEFEVEYALSKLTIVPSVALMDSTLKKHSTELKSATKAKQERDLAIQATKQHLEAISSPTNVPMPEDVKVALRSAGLLK